MELDIRQNKDIAIHDFQQSWLSGQLSENTARSYITDIRQFQEFVKKPLEQVSRQDIFRYRAHLVQSLAPSSVNRHLSAIRQLFVEAVRHQLISINPSEGITGFKIDSQYSSTLCPSYEEVRKMLEVVFEGKSMIDVRDAALLYVFCTMGLRRDEVSKLRVNSIVTDSGKNALDVFGKGSKHRRVEIPGSCFGIIQKWILTAELSDNEPLFCEIRKGGNITRKPLTGSGLYHIVLKRMTDAGLEGYSPHSLRHFLITYLIENKASIYDVQKIAGHSSTRITEKYDHSNRLASSAAELIDF